MVDDGSKDKSYPLLEKEHTSQVKVLKMSRNVGHQRALLAGMHWVADRCDCMISIDLHLQDDLQLLSLSIFWEELNCYLLGLLASILQKYLWKQSIGHIIISRKYLNR